MAKHAAPTSGRRLPRWARWLLAALALAAVALAGAAWRVQVLADRALREIVEETEALLTEVRAGDGRRPVVVGPASPGEAWPHYRRALASLTADPPDPDVLETLDRGTTDRAALDALAATLEHHGETLEHLARGTAAGDATLALDWELGYRVEMPDYLQCGQLADLARARARLLRAAGSPAEAAAWLLRGCQLGRDVGHNTTLVGEAVGCLALGRCLEDLAALARDDLDPAQLLALAGPLERLERGLPTWSVAQRNEAVFAGFALHSLCTSPDLEPELGLQLRLVSWRYLFSPALMAADTWRPVRELARIVEGSPGRSWLETRALLERAGERMRATPNPLLEMLATRTLMGSENVRRILAMVRLLRAGVALRAGGERLDLADPFGTRLLVAPGAGSGALHWSVGPDGADNSGRGDFSYDGSSLDIVLDLRR